jgi:hypothetical protein
LRSLPEVPEEVVASVEGANVAIVARHDDPNPGNDWMETRIVVEVSGTESHIDEVASTLATNGWDTRDVSDYAPTLLIEAERAEASLVVLTLDDFMSTGILEPAEAFSKVEVKLQNSYFVVSIMPIY